MAEENKFKRAAELLLKGAKMLNIACPICNDPIYELKDGKLFCSTCQKNIVKSEAIIKTDENKINTVHHPIIQCKINELLLILEEEKNLDKINELVNLLDKLSKLNNLQ